MPTWPKGTKASTTNVDAGSDQISQARADIKQNIDNVNTIIDTFDIQPDSAGQPVNGDLLQYNSTDGNWQPVASTAITISTSGTGASFLSGDLSTTIAVGDHVETVSSIPPANGLISNVTGNEWKFAQTGTYHFQFNGTATTAQASVYFKIKNVTQSNSTTIYQIQSSSKETHRIKTLVVTSTDDAYSLVTSGAGSSTKTLGTPEGWSLFFYKF